MLTRQGQKSRFVTTQNVCDRGVVVLGFALREAARAVKVPALFTSSRFRLRLECLP